MQQAFARRTCLYWLWIVVFVADEQATDGKRLCMSGAVQNKVVPPRLLLNGVKTVTFFETLFVTHTDDTG